MEDTDAIAKYGIVSKTIQSFGCTSRGQAARMGKWFLYNEQKSGETCTFKITPEAGTLVRCGQIISISDPVKSGLRRGGKIKSATTTAIVVDDSANTDLDITNNATLANNYQAVADERLREARFIDATENALDTVEANEFTDARL